MVTPTQKYFFRPHRKKKKTCRVCGCTDNDSSECVKLTGCPCHWVEKDLCSACADIGMLTRPPKWGEGYMRWEMIQAQRFPKIQKEIMEHE